MKQVKTLLSRAENFGSSSSIERTFASTIGLTGMASAFVTHLEFGGLRLWDDYKDGSFFRSDKVLCGLDGK